MKTFRDLEIYPNAGPSVLADLLTNHLPDGWSRSREAEENVFTKTATYYCFTCENRPGVENATMYFVERADQGIHVANIISSRKSELSHAEYNAILEDFTKSVVYQVPDWDKHLVMIFPDKIDVEVLLGSEGYRLLQQYANSANRSTGSAHPSDREMWFDFIWHVHRNAIDFEPSVLKRYMSEEAKWPIEQACQLTIEYEFALGLLRYRRQEG
jgi:hypothetical protein